MRLRTAIFVGVLVLVSAVLGTVLYVVTSRIDRNARDTVADDLERSRQVFEDLQSYRVSLYRETARVTAEEPRVRAVAATQDIDHETVLTSVRESQSVLKCDLFVMTDGRGTLLADFSNPEAFGFDMSENALVAETLKTGESSGIWIADGNAYQVQGRRLDFGTTAVASVAIGYKIDDRVALTVRRQTGSAVLITLDGKPIAASATSDDGKTLSTAALAALDALPETGSVEATLDGERWLVAGGRVPGYEGEAHLRYFVLRSLDRALAVRRTLERTLLLVGAGALVAALLIAMLLASRLARPIGALVGFTRRVAIGDLAARAPSSSLRETNQLSAAMNEMVSELERSRGQVAQKERLEKEMEIAKKIQTSILPQSLVAPGLEVSAMMLPASEVGGDYYDFLPFADGCWVGIGDVAGHGLTAGLVMMMVQSIVSALTRDRPDTTPRDAVRVLNHVLFENIRHRLENDEHVTFSLMRFTKDGKIVFAGAHEEILIWRAATKVNLVSTPGTWVGAVADIDRFTFNTEEKLEPGDVMVLYTDGVTEAANRSGEMFGPERLAAELEAAAAGTAEHIRDSILDKVLRWTHEQQDDVTLLVIRYVGGA